MSMRLRWEWVRNNFLCVQPMDYRVIVERDRYWREVMIPWIQARSQEVAGKRRQPATTDGKP